MKMINTMSCNLYMTNEDQTLVLVDDMPGALMFALFFTYTLTLQERDLATHTTMSQTVQFMPL